jgi:hypothetical protein
MRNWFLPTLIMVAVALPAGARLFEQEPGNDDIATANIQMTVPSDANVVMADSGLLTFSNAGGDLDYLGIGGLHSGDIVEVVTTPLGDPPFFEIPDTIVGLFNDSGAVACEGDDAYNNDLDQFPTGFGSLCRYEIPLAGDYFVGVTGFSPNPFDGAHIEQGLYSLTVSITRLPEPGVMLQLAAGGLGLAVLCARRRRANGGSERHVAA